MTNVYYKKGWPEANLKILYPHCDSNAGLRLRRPTLCPLSYGGIVPILPKGKAMDKENEPYSKECVRGESHMGGFLHQPF